MSHISDGLLGLLLSIATLLYGIVHLIGQGSQITFQLLLLVDQPGILDKKKIPFYVECFLWDIEDRTSWSWVEFNELSTIVHRKLV